MKPLALDLFCGAGGATRGLQLAGFHVTGVDIKAQPRYCGDEFHQAEALTFPLDGFDFIWASPPCQAFTQMSARWRGTGGKADSHVDLITPIRDRLVRNGKAYVIENVVGARKKLLTPFLLKGGNFGLGVHRPRLFECSEFILTPKGIGPLPGFVGVYGERPDGRRLWTRLNGNGTKRSEIRCAKTLAQGSKAMGIDWMDWSELKESIPPAYAEFIGRQLLEAL